MGAIKKTTRGGKRKGAGRKALPPALRRNKRLMLELRAAEKAAYQAAAKAKGKRTATWAVEELNQAAKP